MKKERKTIHIYSSTYTLGLDQVQQLPARVQIYDLLSWRLIKNTNIKRKIM